MSYDESDFVLMTTPTEVAVLINISKIKYITQRGDTSRLFFGAGEDDYIVVKGTLDDIMEIL